MTKKKNIYEKLAEAKKNIEWLLKNPDGLVDMHGLAYWGDVVEALRKEIKKYI